MPSIMGKRKKNKGKEVVSRHFDYRVPVYIEEQYTQKPKDFAKEVRRNWLLGIAFNALSILFVSLAVFHVLSENAASEIKLVRIDGVEVVEGRDVRRDVLMKNALQRARMKAANNGKK